MSELDTLALHRNQLIEASAGTGKTYTITNLYLRLLLGRDTGLEPLAVDRILTLTFTNAATDQLRYRIRNRIHQARLALRQGADQKDGFLERLVRESPHRERDESLLATAVRLLDDACIFTIHGFCSRLLSEQSFDTGNLFRQKPEANMEQLLQQASADCFRSFLMTLAPLEKQLADELWKTPGELATALKPYVSREDLELTPPVPLHGRQEALEGLSASIRAVKQGWFSHGVEDWLKSLGLKGNCRPPQALAADD